MKSYIKEQKNIKSQRHLIWVRWENVADWTISNCEKLCRNMKVLKQQRTTRENLNTLILSDIMWIIINLLAKFKICRYALNMFLIILYL